MPRSLGIQSSPLRHSSVSTEHTKTASQNTMTGRTVSQSSSRQNGLSRSQSVSQMQSTTPRNKGATQQLQTPRTSTAKRPRSQNLVHDSLVQDSQLASKRARHVVRDQYEEPWHSPENPIFHPDYQRVTASEAYPSNSLDQPQVSQASIFESVDLPGTVPETIDPNVRAPLLSEPEPEPDEESEENATDDRDSILALSDIEEQPELSPVRHKNGQLKRSRHRNHHELFTAAVREVFRKIESDARRACLATFTRSLEDKIIETHFAELDKVQPWVHIEAIKKFGNNVNNWRSNSIRNFYGHLQVLCRSHSSFRDETNRTSIQRRLEEFFSIDNFVEVFEFLRGKVEWNRSGEPVEKWCQIIYVEIGTLIKLRMDRGAMSQKDDVGGKISAQSVVDRLTALSGAEKLSRFHISYTDVVMQSALPRKTHMITQRAALDPDDDDELYIPA